MSGRRRIPGTTRRTRRTVRALVLVPSPDQPGLSNAERLALRLRAEATATGRCACGATWTPGRIRRGEAVRVRMLHEHDCPAADGPHLRRLVERLGDSIEYQAVVVEMRVAA